MILRLRYWLIVVTKVKAESKQNKRTAHGEND